METFKCWANQKKSEECENKCENKFIARNRRLLQEECIAFCKGNNLPIHVFSEKEVMKMSNFADDHLLQEQGHFRIYRGTKHVEKQAICIKKFNSVIDFVGVEGIIREIVIAAQMTMHNHSLKLLGCCLETDFPVIVYKYPDLGCLADDTSRQQKPLPWKFRLRISCEISHAIAYLHNGFRRPIVFRNLHSGDVFLDKEYVAKLTGYCFSVVIPEGENHVNDAIVSTTGFVAPECSSSGRLTVKTDVYCFGVLLLELLVDPSRYHGSYNIHRLLMKIKDHGKKVDIGRIVDPAISREIKENGKQQQLQDVYDLALRCVNAKENDRPNMVDVAVELNKMLDSS